MRDSQKEGEDNGVDQMNRFIDEILESGDAQRVHLGRLVRRIGSCAKASDYDTIFELAQEGRNLARAIGENWLFLLFSHFSIVARSNMPVPDFRGGMEEALEALVASAGEEDYPMLPCLHHDVVAAHIETDPIGYQREIAQSIHQLTQRARGTCRRCIINCRMDTYLASDRFDDAEQFALNLLEALNRVAPEPELESPVGLYATLSYVAFSKGDWEACAKWADLCSSDHDDPLALLWQAISCRISGNEQKGLELLKLAISRAKRAATRTTEFFDAVCIFHELQQDFRSVLKYRLKQWRRIRRKDYLAKEFRALIEALRAFAMLGGPRPNHVLRYARQLAQKFRTPTAYPFVEKFKVSQPEWFESIFGN